MVVECSRPYPWVVECIQNFFSENLKVCNVLGGLGVDGDNIKMDSEDVFYEGVDFIHLAQDRFSDRLL